MAELDHASMEFFIQSGGAQEDLSQLPYAKSLDQHTRVKDREQVLHYLKIKDPTAIKEPLKTVSKTGEFLLKKADPENFVTGQDNMLGVVVNIMVHEGGSVYVPDVMEAAHLSAGAAKRLQIQNVLEINPFTNSFESVHLPAAAIPAEKLPAPVTNLRPLHEGVPIALGPGKIQHSFAAD